VNLFALLATGRVVPDLTLSVFGGGPRAGHSDALLWTSAAILSIAVVVATTIGRLVRGVFDGMLRRALLAQEESLRTHGESARELSALAAEIAHEIKNPLASVKGLAGLLSQSLPDGKGAERLAVLRREVDRMQSIVEEFLGFSRPLIPLATEPVDLGMLCTEVARLHEGMARERGVVLEVKDDGALARCDPRKVKQILINLVQNALEASPPGSTVSLETATEDGHGVVRVHDRGRGLDAEVADRVFAAGFTTKEHGSGLGLTIARAIARQHGGELDLRAREGGGAVATLRLPARGPAA